MSEPTKPLSRMISGVQLHNRAIMSNPQAASGDIAPGADAPKTRTRQRATRAKKDS